MTVIYFGTTCLPFSPSLCYLVKSVEYPKDLQTKLDRTSGKHNEDHNINLEIKPSTTRIIYSKILTSTLVDEFVQDEEEEESSTQSIRIEESLLVVTPSPATLEVYEISNISSSHMADTEEDIGISDIEEKHCCTSMQTFSSDSFLNYVQSFPLIASENEEEFDFYPSNVVIGVKISNNLDILEII